MDTKNLPRRYDLDWLRVLAFSGVFLYHCSRFFDGSNWHIKDSTSSALVDILKSIFDLWGMPLIFLISGASIFFALRPGGAARFIRDRALRLLVPLGLGILVLGPPQIYLERLTHGQFQGSLLDFLPLYFGDWHLWGGNFAWSGVHLWYLEDLFLVTLVLLPLFAALKSTSGRRFIDAFGRLSARPGAIYLWTLPLGLILALVDPLGVLRPRLSEDLTRLVVFAPFLPLGFLVFSDSRIQQAIIRQRRISLALAVILTLGFTKVEDLLSQGAGYLIYILVMLLGSILIWSWLLLILGYGMRYLGSNHRLLSYANEAVLPIYILHQPVILILGYFIIPLPLPILVKYLLILPSAFAVSLSLYEFGIRRVNLARRLFGLKPRKLELQPASLAAQPM